MARQLTLAGIGRSLVAHIGGNTIIGRDPHEYFRSWPFRVTDATMHDAAEHLTALDSMASHWIRIVGLGIGFFGVLAIVVGIAWSPYRFLHPMPSADAGIQVDPVAIRDMSASAPGAPVEKDAGHPGGHDVMHADRR